MQKNEKEAKDYYAKYIKTTNPIIISITKKSNLIHCDKAKKRVKDILVSIIKKEKDSLRKICFEGLPDDLPVLRSLIWKINLRLLNLEVDKWAAYIKKKREEYEDIKLAFMLKMDAERKLYEELTEFQLKKQNTENNENSDSNTTINKREKELTSFIQCTDKDLLEEIDKDIRRTHTDLNFFFMPSRKEYMKNLTNEEIREVVDKRRSNDVKTYEDIYINRETTKFETNADVLCRILYIYAKLNPDIVYVQGMNELIAPIYFCYSSDYQQQQSFESDVEADTFWSFTFLMDDLKVLYMKSKDDAKEGIFRKIEILNDLIKIIDKDIYAHFTKHAVELSHFAFKWFILFFTQDFILPDVLRLWDTIFCEKDRFYFVFMVSLAIIKLRKNKILSNDFAGIILCLQNLEDLDVELIISEVTKIKKGFDKKIKKTISKNSK